MIRLGFVSRTGGRGFRAGWTCLGVVIFVIFGSFLCIVCVSIIKDKYVYVMDRKYIYVMDRYRIYMYI